MTDSQPDDEEHLTESVAESLLGDEEEGVGSESQEEGGDGDGSCIWTEDACTQEVLEQCHNRPVDTTTISMKATYEHCQILRRQLEIYRDKICEIWDPEEEMGVGADRTAIDNWVKEQLVKWVGWEGNPTPKPMRDPDKKQPFISKKHEKARLRQFTQSFYEQSPSHCIKAVLSGNLEITEAIPRKELEKYWTGIFSKKPEGVSRVETVNRPSDVMYSAPISIEEIKEGLKKLKDNSPGPDGLKKSDVVRIPLEILHAMLLIFQGSSYTPKFLSLGVVTLVPKTANPENSRQYRPITVTSQLLRLYHGIIAKRLIRLPLSKRQKAFLPRDGIAENAFIIEHLIKGTRARKDDLYLVFMDVAKVFDSLAHTSLLQAKKEISSRFREGCDLCEVTHMYSGVPALTNDPIKTLKIGIADNTYICHCKVCKQKYPHETIPVPVHEDLELPGFSCLSSLVFYAIICIHPDCASKVKYVGSTTQQLSARMGTHMSAGNNLLRAHDILQKGKTKIAILEAYTNGKHIKQLLEK